MEKTAKKSIFLLGSLSAILAGVCWYQLAALMSHASFPTSTWYDVAFYALLLTGIFALSGVLLCVDKLLSPSS